MESRNPSSIIEAEKRAGNIVSAVSRYSKRKGAELQNYLRILEKELNLKREEELDIAIASPWIRLFSKGTEKPGICS